MLTLLTARTTDTSYPTDVALQKVWNTFKDASELQVVQFEFLGTFDGATVAYQVSTDGGTNWQTGAVSAVAAGLASTAVYFLPGWMIRPVVTSAGAGTTVTMKMFP
jgi:hypothetical protein